MRSRIIGAFVVIAALSISLWIGAGARAQRPADEPTNQDVASAAAVTTPLLLQYQGRLADPGTGEAVIDGTYTMSFRLYDVESDGTALWNEIKDVSVQGGVFNAMLGDFAEYEEKGLIYWLDPESEEVISKFGKDGGDEFPEKQRVILKGIEKISR